MNVPLYPEIFSALNHYTCFFSLSTFATANQQNFAPKNVVYLLLRYVVEKYFTEANAEMAETHAAAFWQNIYLHKMSLSVKDRVLVGTRFSKAFLKAGAIESKPLEMETSASANDCIKSCNSEVLL